jgi:hypothetical protein
VKVRVVIRDNTSDRSVALTGELPPGDLDFLNTLGERIAQGTDWEVAVVAVEEKE